MEKLLISKLKLFDAANELLHLSLTKVGFVARSVKEIKSAIGTQRRADAESTFSSPYRRGETGKPLQKRADAKGLCQRQAKAGSSSQGRIEVGSSS